MTRGRENWGYLCCLKRFWHVGIGNCVFLAFIDLPQSLDALSSVIQYQCVKVFAFGSPLEPDREEEGGGGGAGVWRRTCEGPNGLPVLGTLSNVVTRTIPRCLSYSS